MSSLVHLFLVDRPHIDLTYYFGGFGPLDMQLFALLIWIHLQAAAFAVYPMFRVSGAPADVMLCMNLSVAILGVAVAAEESAALG